MISLYQVGDCDVYIEAELKAAGITRIWQKKPMRGEVPARVTGRFTKNGVPAFFFRRAWDHWMIQGFVPLKAAMEIYNNTSGIGRRDISVIGDETCPSPEKWAKPNYKELQRQGLYVEGMTTEEGEQVAQEHNIPWGIDYYHIYSLEALVYFVDKLQRSGLITR